MLQDLPNQDRLAADIASDFILFIYLHYYFRGLLHQAICATWALIIISFAAESTEELSTVRILTLKWLVDNFMAYSAQEIFIQIINTRFAQSENIKALVLLTHHHLIIYTIGVYLRKVLLAHDRIMLNFYLLLILLWMKILL